MKFSATLFFLLSVSIVYGQHLAKQIKTLKKYDGTKLVLLEQHDKNGNCYFERSDSLYDKEILVIARTFDSSNRITRYISASSFHEFSVSEIEHEPFLSKHYSYKTRILYHPDTAIYKLISKITTKEELENMDTIKAILKTQPYLSSIRFFDDHKNLKKDIYFDKNGDTSHVSNFRYNKWNKEEYWGNDAFEHFQFFDGAGNEIKSVHISSLSGQADTLATTYFKYSSTNQKIEEMYYHRSDVIKTVYTYNTKNQLIEEKTDSEKDRTRTLYKYDKWGNETEEKMFDLNKSKDKPEYIYRTVYEYW